MNEIVFLKNDDVFTDSRVIAEETGVQHHAVTQLIKKHKNRIEKFGKLRFSHLKCQNSKGGRPE